MTKAAKKPRVKKTAKKTANPSKPTKRSNNKPKPSQPSNSNTRKPRLPSCKLPSKTTESKTKHQTKITVPSKKLASAFGPRRSPKEIHEILFHAISKMRAIGVVDCPKLLLAVEADFTSPRSDGFKMAINDLSNQGLVEKGKDRDHLRLTTKGIKAVDDDDDDDTPADNAQIQEHLLGIFKKRVSNDLQVATFELWTTLIDGRTHTVDKLAASIGYPNRRSPKFLNLIQALMELELIKKEGTVVQLADFVFPDGRP